MMDWFGKTLNARDLVCNELLPLSQEGLQSAGITPGDIDLYLGIIRQRMERHQTGSRWQIRNYRKLRDSFGSAIALTELTKLMYEHQQNESPVHEWSDLQIRQTYIFECESCPVSKMMITDIYTVQEDEPVCLVKSIMEWKNIRHLPVENLQGELVGLVTATHLRSFEGLAPGWEQRPIKDFMVHDLITVAEDAPLQEMSTLMQANKVGSILIVHDRKLVGIITKTDIEALEAMWKKT